ncbi:topology modulation protein [Enterococcus hirae]
MKIVILGQSGSGKSTLARTIQETAKIPLLPLDFLWHGTDYSEKAQVWFQLEQENFMDKHENWIIEGNYLATARKRLQEADQIILLRVPTYLAMARVIKRTLKRKRDRATRPDMPNDFTEKLDKEYLDFLCFVWRFKRKNEPRIFQLIDTLQVKNKLLILDNKRDRQKYINQLKKNKPIV